MSTSEDSMDTTSPSAPTDGTTIGECLLDVLCVKHSSKPGGLILYEDSLRANIIGELSLEEFLCVQNAKYIFAKVIKIYVLVN